jgi:GTP pyrophosphokinase
MYYQAIAENELAVMVKFLDRCCNVSGMSGGFTKKRMVEYIQETEEWFYPMIENAKKDYPEYENSLFAMKYHILSVVETIKHLL